MKLIKLLNKKLSIILKRWKKVSHTDPFLLLPFFFFFILFLYLNEYVQHAVPCGPLCRTFIYTYGRQSTYVTHKFRDSFPGRNNVLCEKIGIFFSQKSGIFFHKSGIFSQKSGIFSQKSGIFSQK